MPESVPITYREFWDVPRIFFASHAGRLYLFDCPFDEAVEDYPNSYQVFVMPPLSDAELAGSWENISRRAVRSVGEVPIPAVRFDPSRRKTIGAEVFDLIPTHAVPVNGAAGHAAPTGATEPVP